MGAVGSAEGIVAVDVCQLPAACRQDLGGCQNYGPFLGTLNIRGRIIIGTPKRDHNFDTHPFKV